MKRRPPEFAGRAQQRGVALIIALILVSLATILAVKLGFDGWLERRRTIGIIATEQAYLFGTGAEALAADALNQIGQSGAAASTTGSSATSGQGAVVVAPGQSAQQVNLTQPWAQPTQPLPITSPDRRLAGRPSGPAGPVQLEQSRAHDHAEQPAGRRPGAARAVSAAVDVGRPRA
jgi:type II secretory pathway component PulK